jgi:3-hydroxybutyryl-CoA dehydratase
MKTASEFTVGDTFEVAREVDAYRPIYYAGASGDYNPIHIDPDIGKLAGYHGVILQGLCTYAWVAEACVAYLGDPGRLKRLRARFTKPVQIGDVLTFRGRCTAIDGGVARVEVTATNQDGEEVLKGAVAEGRIGEG